MTKDGETGDDAPHLAPSDLVRVAMFAYYVPYLEDAFNNIGSTIAIVDGKKREDAPDAEFAVVLDSRPLSMLVKDKSRWAWLDFAAMAVMAAVFVAARVSGAELAAGIAAGSGLMLAVDLVRRFHQIGHQRRLAALITEMERKVGR